ncbi:MAG: hypothetical protein AAF066_17095 [Pseudomonadota bacterium]
MSHALTQRTRANLRFSGDDSAGLGHLDERGGQTQSPTDAWYGFGRECMHALQRHLISGVLGGTYLDNTGRDQLALIKVEET